MIYLLGLVEKKTRVARTHVFLNSKDKIGKMNQRYSPPSERI
jgi:hypothetical protein